MPFCERCAKRRSLRVSIEDAASRTVRRTVSTVGLAVASAASVAATATARVKSLHRQHPQDRVNHKLGKSGWPRPVSSPLDYPPLLSPSAPRLRSPQPVVAISSPMAFATSVY